MTFPEGSGFSLTGDVPICRILNGMWQVSGAHGAIDPEAALRSMFGTWTPASGPGIWWASS